MTTIRFKAVGPREHPTLRPTREELALIHLGPGEYTSGSQVYAVTVIWCGDWYVTGYVKAYDGKWPTRAPTRKLPRRWLAYNRNGLRLASVVPAKTREAAGKGVVSVVLPSVAVLP